VAECAEFILAIGREVLRPHNMQRHKT